MSKNKHQQLANYFFVNNVRRNVTWPAVLTASKPCVAEFKEVVKMMLGDMTRE